MLLGVEDIVGPQEIGAMLGVGRQRVFQLTQEPDFPAPVAVLGMGKVWLKADVRRWAESKGRTVHS